MLLRADEHTCAWRAGQEATYHLRREMGLAGSGRPLDGEDSTDAENGVLELRPFLRIADVVGGLWWLRQ